MLTRRAFLQTTAAAAAFSQPAARRKRIAVLATSYAHLSYAQQITDPFLVGYPFGGAWHMPDIQVASLYTDYAADGDLSLERAGQFGFTIHSTVEETLRCGSATLAVDGVLIIADQYPQREFFNRCAAVFEKDGRTVPVYTSGPLAQSFDEAQAIVAACRRARTPLLAGSPLPVTWRLPELELPAGCHIEEALMVAPAESSAMIFAALEGLQCMVERRGEGETGVRAVQMLEGDAVWKAGDEGRWSRELLISALSRSDTPLGLSETESRPQDLVTSGQLPRIVGNPAAYLIEYRDGLHATLLVLNGALKDFNFAARLKGNNAIQSTQFLLTPSPNCTYYTPLVHAIETMTATGTAPYPAERAMLAGGIQEACLTSKVREHARVETPRLAVAYRPPAESQYCRS